MKSQVKAIVFDSDGTLLDTRDLIVKGYQTVLKRHNLEHLTDRNYIIKRLGKPIAETYEQLLAGNHTSLNIKSLVKEHDIVQDKLVEYIKPYTGLSELLSHWKSMGIKLCIFTSGTRYMIERNFAQAGIHDVDAIFDSIITADENIARKPHPDTILELLKRVQVPIHHAILVGDHMYDAMGGHQAKIRLTIGILHGFGEAEELLSSGADVLVKDLFSLNNLIQFASESPH